MTYPSEVLKSRLQQRFLGERAYSGLVDCARKLVAKEGMGGFYKGFMANLLRVAPQSAITMVSYEYIAKLLQ